MIAMAVGTVWLRLSIVRTTYDINQSEKSIRTLRQQREETELRLAGTRSPRRLEALARERFHMAQPRAEQVVHVK